VTFIASPPIRENISYGEISKTIFARICELEGKQ